jgi:predicted MFS family arabinose efflux permease
MTLPTRRHPQSTTGESMLSPCRHQWHLQCLDTTALLLQVSSLRHLFLNQLLICSQGGAITLPSFETRYGLATASGDQLAALKSNIVSTFQAGCFFGAILCYPLSEKLGRKIPLLVCGVLFNIGVIMQLASTGLGLIYTGRAFTGMFLTYVFFRL